MRTFRRGDVVTPYRRSSAQDKAVVTPGIMYNVADVRLFKTSDGFEQGLILSQKEAMWLYSPSIAGYWWGSLFKLVYRPPYDFVEKLLKGKPSERD